MDFNKIIAWFNDNWSEIVALVDKIWAFLLDNEEVFQ